VKENVGSLRTYFVLVGVLGLFTGVWSLVQLPPSASTPFVGLSLCFSAGFLYVGLRFDQLIPGSALRIQQFVWINAVVNTLGTTVRLLVPGGTTVPSLGLAGVSLALVWAITFYLVSNVRRLSSEATTLAAPVAGPGTSSRPPMWLPDPAGRHELRYWDGAAWTGHVSDGGQAGTDPVSTSAAQVTPTASQPGSALRTFGRLTVIVGGTIAVVDLIIFGLPLFVLPLAYGASVNPAGVVVLVGVPVLVCAAMIAGGISMQRKAMAR